MTKFLLKKFIHSTDYQDAKTRYDMGVLSSIVGIVCNVLLFVVKFIMGTLTNSIAIVSDAFNNLSDSLSSLVTIVGYRLSSKPADKEHPFGHGRLEYLTTLFVAVVILFVGFELFKSSLLKIIHPEVVKFNIVALVALSLSVLLKLWLSYFNRVLAKKAHSDVMMAVAQDARNDVFATLATIVSLVSSLFFSFSLDGIMGVIVSLFIMKSGVDIFKDIIDKLLGQPIDADIYQAIQDLILEEKTLLGMHDLLIHVYGPTVRIGSCHVEVDANADVMSIHEVVDRVESEIEEKFGIVMTIHTDPVQIEDQELRTHIALLDEAVKNIDPSMLVHDVCLEEKVLHFDVDVPPDCDLTDDQIHQDIQVYLKEKGCTYSTAITIDRGYVK